MQPGQISSKPRQALLDYALWQGQTGWIHDLATASRFEPALRIAQAMDAAGHPYRYDRFEAQEAPKFVAKKVAMVAERQRQPYAGRSFKDVLRQCDQFGVDHRTYFNATPLMLAAQCGNVALVEALLERGADPRVRDHYGHSAWDYALERFLDDTGHNEHHLDALYPLLSPPVLDVQTGSRLIRLERHQGEYWLLGLMLASYKKLYSQAVPNPQVQRNLKGFCADHLMRHVERMPESVLRPERRRRTYFNGVLARAEVNSSYQPSRQLWLRTQNGCYTFNPELQLRAHGGAEWVPWKQWLNQPLVYAGCGIMLRPK